MDIPSNDMVGCNRLLQAGARLGDMVLLLDADELVRRETVETIRRCEAVDMPTNLELEFLRYNFHWSADSLKFHAAMAFVSLLVLTSPVTVRYSVEQNSFTPAAQVRRPF